MFAMVACISATTLYPLSNPLNARTSPVQTASSFPAFWTFATARKRSPIAGLIRLILNSAVTTSQCAGAFVKAAPGPILNVHPSLLPAFPGLEAQRQAFDHGVKVSGATVHLVVEDLDAGPIVLQEAVTVREDDTAESLAARILEAEHRIYPSAVRIMLEGRGRLEGRRLRIEGRT